jgi:S-formylglutathione hydrolase FrmB
LAKHPSKGNTIQYIYTNSQHKDPLRRVIPLEILQKGESRENTAMNYDREKYRQMILDGAETVLGYFGFDRTVYENPRNNGRKKKQWYEELHEERTKDIQAEMTTEKQ